MPNLVAKAVHFNGQTFYESESLSLDFEKEDRRLTVELQPDQTSYAPRDKVDLSVSVKDKNGTGQKSEVNISLVDEAYFKIQGQTVSILENLYRSVSSGVFQSYASHQYPVEANQGAEGGGCFLAGTKVLLADGRTKNIEDIKSGETILTRESEISPKLLPAEVLETFKHLVGSYLLINGHLRVTPEHNLYINGRWKVAADLRLGDHLLNDQNNWIPVTSIERRRGSFTVYNLAVAKYGTYFADGFYAHNQKGRELFTDRAFFGLVKTDESGRGRISFKLPDNLTSWRITSQAISQSLGAGQTTKFLPVHLPFFVDLVLNTEYLEGDRPTVKIRAFGEQLAENQTVEFTIKAPSLGLSKDGEKLSSSGFTAINFPLSALVRGEHTITVSARAGDLADTISRTFNVYKSRLTKTEANYYTLSENENTAEIIGADEGPTTLVFSDGNRGRYYQTLAYLSGTYGDRVDQKIARVKAQEFRRVYFKEDLTSENFPSSNYQTPSGGISLFPYSDEDLALSAGIAALTPDLFDRPALIQYFSTVLNDRGEGTERTAIALYGLSTLGEPVLNAIERLAERKDLTPKEELYLGLARAAAGDKEGGRLVLKNILSKYGENYAPYRRIKVGVDQDDIIEDTALTAELAAVLNDSAAEPLFLYIINNDPKETRVYLEQLNYLQLKLPQAEGKPVSFTYNLNGKEVKNTLANDQILKLQLSGPELKNIKFSAVHGQVGLTGIYTVPLIAAAVKKDSNIALLREYSVDNQPKNEFRESDLVKVTLKYRFGPQSLDGCYQVSDLLPSGLKIVNQTYSRGLQNENVWYPYAVTNQKVDFCVYRGDEDKPITYYARVVSGGDYLGESAVIQSLRSAESLNLSPATAIKIK